MAGYSGTPLRKKIGIKDESRVLLVAAPGSVAKALEVAKAQLADGRGELDVAMLFVRRAAELKKEFPKLAKRLAPAGMLWVAWPKKSSGMATDLSENSIRDYGLQQGVVDVKVCAVDETWSGLKFVIRLKDRKKS